MTVRLTTSAAILALIAGLGGTALAQAPADAPATQAAPAAQASPDALPEALAALDLQGLEIETRRGGFREVEGRTADDVKIEATVGPRGELFEAEAEDGALPQSLIEAMLPEAARQHEAMALFTRIDEVKRRPDQVEVKGDAQGGDEIKARFDGRNALVGFEADDGAIPDTVIAALLPPAVRDSQILSQFDRLDEIQLRRGVFMVEGEDSAGEDMRAAVDAEGRVMRFGRADDDRRGPRGDDMRGGPRGHEMRGGEHRRDGHGPRGEWREGKGPGGDGPRGDGPGRGMPDRAAAPAFDPVAVQQRLADAGYGQFGFLRADGPRSLIEATNPQGEAVTLELDPTGELVRETAR